MRSTLTDVLSLKADPNTLGSEILEILSSLPTPTPPHPPPG